VREQHIYPTAKEALKMQFEAAARRHWTKYLPEMTKEMKAAGTFEKEVKEAAKAAMKEYAALVSGGTRTFAAKEIVMKEYILLEPETTE
jgi:hypothetical protein